MKARLRYPAGNIWRIGFKGLRKLQDKVDRLLETHEDDELVTMLAEVKLRLNRELRENAVAEMRLRKEHFEVQDMSLARAAAAKTDEELLAAVAEMRRQTDAADAEATDDGQAADTTPEAPPSSETHPDGTATDTTTEDRQALSDQSVTPGTETVH